MECCEGGNNTAYWRCLCIKLTYFCLLYKYCITAINNKYITNCTQIMDAYHPNHWSQLGDPLNHLHKPFLSQFYICFPSSGDITAPTTKRQPFQKSINLSSGQAYNGAHLSPDRFALQRRKCATKRLSKCVPEIAPPMFPKAIIIALPTPLFKSPARLFVSQVMDVGIAGNIPIAVTMAPMYLALSLETAISSICEVSITEFALKYD